MHAGIYRVTVDPSQSIEELISIGDQFLDNSNINSQSFPIEDGEKTEIDMTIFYFDHDISDDEIIEAMNEKNMKPANPNQLLSFGVKYRDVQENFPILALGAVWGEYAVCLAFDGFMAGRLVGLEKINEKRKSCWRYLAVPK